MMLRQEIAGHWVTVAGQGDDADYLFILTSDTAGLTLHGHDVEGLLALACATLKGCEARRIVGDMWAAGLRLN